MSEGDDRSDMPPCTIEMPLALVEEREFAPLVQRRVAGAPPLERRQRYPRAVQAGEQALQTATEA